MPMNRAKYPALPDWTLPQTTSASELPKVLATASAAGFRAQRLTVLESGVYLTEFIPVDPMRPELERKAAG